ncbi:MAG TPA: nickel pincer cofactor biosynthesis protein LarC [Candidatus Brocadiia bacterium]|nr:nickel pincer cofactor biosynthesis protein LarC [Candidatus Brocadiia bacterium]
MRIAYFDCFAGVSGDMILGALIDAGLPAAGLNAALQSLRLHGVEVRAEKASRQGIAATGVEVVEHEQEHGHHEHHHDHRHLDDIESIISGSSLSETVKEKSLRVFRRLAEAEAEVHGCSVNEVHFHELGAVDTIVDIVGAVWGLAELGIERVMFSSIATGSGEVVCAHGRLPVPAPATARLLIGTRSHAGHAQYESATPTGVSLLTTLGECVPGLPEMIVEKVGHGAGHKDTKDVPNVLRIIIGASADAESRDSVWVVEANIDDMTGEQLGYAFERLFAAGALDVYAQPIQMKKSRPGTLLCALCEASGLARVQETFLRETSTFGVRCRETMRRKLEREIIEVETPWGKVRAKVGRLNGETLRIVPEYEDCRRIAESRCLSFAAVYNAALKGTE